MKYLLVAPRYVERYGEPRTFPLGMAYISAVLKAAGHTVVCVDLNYEQARPVEVVQRLMRQHDPDVLGMGAVSTYIDQVKAVFAAARQVKPSIINIVGNTVFSVDPETILTHLDVDIGVSGEGERTMAEVAAALENGTDLAEIGGIGFRNRDGQVVITGRRKPDLDIDGLPWPDYEGFELERSFQFYKRTQFSDGSIKPKRPGQIITSRSCAFGCTFCFHPLGVRRERNFDDVFREIDFLIEHYDINYLSILDELFAFKRERVLEFCRRIRDYDLDWEVSLHSSIADEEVISAMRGARCVSIGYGVESASNSVLKSMRKKTTIDVIEKALELTHRNDIEILANVIFGDIAETLETANETLDWWTRHRHYQLSLFPLCIYPGTWIYKEGIRRGAIDRVESVLNVRPLRNLTEMDDVTLGMMRFKLGMFRSTLLRPAPVVSMTRHGEPHPVWGELVDIGWRCPHCGTDNMVPDEAKYFDISRRFALRVGCCKCHNRWDIRNPCNVTIQSRNTEEAYRQAMEMINQQRWQEAVRLLDAILAKSSWHAPSGFACGQALRRLGNLRGAISRVGGALTNDPYNILYMITFADLMNEEGCPGAARLYYEQVLAFEPFNQEAWMKLEALRSGPAERLAIYFADHGGGRQVQPVPEHAVA